MRWVRCATGAGPAVWIFLSPQTALKAIKSVSRFLLYEMTEITSTRLKWFMIFEMVIMRTALWMDGIAI